MMIDDDDDDGDMRRWSLGHGGAIPSLMVPSCFLAHASYFDMGFLINADDDASDDDINDHTIYQENATTGFEV